MFPGVYGLLRFELTGVWIFTCCAATQEDLAKRPETYATRMGSRGEMDREGGERERERGDET